MTQMTDEFEERWPARLRAIAVPGAILLVIAGAIFYFLHDTAGIRREAPPLPAPTLNASEPACAGPLIVTGLGELSAAFGWSTGF